VCLSERRVGALSHLARHLRDRDPVLPGGDFLGDLSDLDGFPLLFQNVHDEPAPTVGQYLEDVVHVDVGFGGTRCDVHPYFPPLR